MRERDSKEEIEERVRERLQGKDGRRREGKEGWSEGNGGEGGREREKEEEIERRREEMIRNREEEKSSWRCGFWKSRPHRQGEISESGNETEK